MTTKVGKSSGKKPKLGGRKKGTPNKATAKVKEAILMAFQKAGGVAYLTRVAKEDPKTFCALLGRVLPMEVTGKDGNPLESTMIHRIELVPLSNA